MLAVLIPVFASPEGAALAYGVSSGTVYQQSDYSVSSYFEAADAINTGINAYQIPITNSSLESYIGSYWVIDNSGYSASLTTVNSTTYRIYDSDNIFSGQDEVYTCVNIPVPDNLKYLFQLGLVSRVSFAAKADSNSNDISFAVGVSVQSTRHTPTANKALTGETSVGGGEISKSQYTESFGTANYIVGHMYTFIDGSFWGNPADLNVYGMTMTISVSDKPTFRVGLSTPNTPGASGNRANLYSSVRYNNTVISQNDWTVCTYNTFGDSYTLTCADVNRYPGAVWRYGKTGPSLTSAFGTAYTSSQTITMNLSTFSSQSYGGQGTYYGAYYGTPSSYTLTLVPPSGYTWRSGLGTSGWTYNGSNLSRTVYYDNNYTIPLANSLFNETGSFAGWYIGSVLSYGNGGVIQGLNITANITLTGLSEEMQASMRRAQFDSALVCALFQRGWRL
ncbi:MAG: hypothetical protein PHC84_04400 [Clostridia bacterium]|nr:hypothetical protein [Clostridia bacterium]